MNKTVTLDGKPSLVLGVMPPNFSFPGATELWVPLNFDVHPGMKQRKAHFMRPVGKLKSGVTIAQAQADTDAIARRLEEGIRTKQELDCELFLCEALSRNHASHTSHSLRLGGFVLLIACANVANLLLFAPPVVRKKMRCARRWARAASASSGR